MAKNSGFEQCPKCGTWRRRDELVIHIHICKSFKCPFCGMPHPNAGEYCHGAKGIVRRTPEGIELPNTEPPKTAIGAYVAQSKEYKDMMEFLSKAEKASAATPA